MSWAFFGLFAGFGAAQALQSTQNSVSLGCMNLACSYSAFVTVGLICPPIITKAIVRVGWRATLIAGACTYITMILSNLVVGRSGYWIQPIANVFVGSGAAILWTTQNFYFGLCACYSGRAAGTGTSAMATKFNNSFFQVFQFSNMSGCLVSSCLMLTFAGIPWMREVLFCVLAVAAICGTAVILLLPSIEVPEPESQDANSPKGRSVSDMYRVLTDTRFGLMLPWIMTQGMTFAFVNSDFNSDIVSPLLGPSYVGFIMTVFFGSGALFTVFWGKLISNQFLTRRTVFIIAGSSWIVLFLVKMIWTREPNFEQQGDVWKPLPGRTVQWLDVTVPLLLAVLAAAGNAYWNPGIPAIMQSFFADSSSLLPAMAAYKALQSLGFAVQFTIGALLKAYPTARATILIVCCLVTFVSVSRLNRLKQPLEANASAVSHVKPLAVALLYAEDDSDEEEPSLCCAPLSQMRWGRNGDQRS